MCARFSVQNDCVLSILVPGRPSNVIFALSCGPYELPKSPGAHETVSWLRLVGLGPLPIDTLPGSWVNTRVKSLAVVVSVVFLISCVKNPAAANDAVGAMVATNAKNPVKMIDR